MTATFTHKQLLSSFNIFSNGQVLETQFQTRQNKANFPIYLGGIHNPGPCPAESHRSSAVCDWEL